MSRAPVPPEDLLPTSQHWKGVGKVLAACHEYRYPLSRF